MRDFTKPGTKLPVIPRGTEMIVHNRKDYIIGQHEDLVSFGYIYMENELFIAADVANTISLNYWFFSLKTIETLATEQGIVFAPIINFTKPGTKLPTIPRGTNIYIYGKHSVLLQERSNFISFGHTVRGALIYILAEAEGYEKNDFFLIEIEEIIRLSKEQEMRKIIGYKCPMDLYGGEIKKDQVIPIGLKNGESYRVQLGILRPVLTYKPSFCQLPNELIESWEPVYEEMETFLTLGSNKTIIHIGKGFIKADRALFGIHVLKNLIGSNSFNFVEDLTVNSTKKYPITLLDAKYKIGCSEFTLDDLKTIEETYERINK